MRCPKCGNEDLQAISDVQGKGASFWKLCFCGLLGLCGAGKTKTIHYWACPKCGHKFKM
jgi:predicted nucleic-acid-binding Zn-ribbon protein